MARIQNVMATEGVTPGAQTPMVDASYGGLNGMIADIPSWVNTTPDVPMNGICFLLEAPLGFRDLQDPTAMTRALKNIVEVHATSWEGIDLGLTVETGEREMGATRTLQYVTRTVRAGVTPTMNVWDVRGGYISRFFTKWIEKLMPNPDTGVVGTKLDGTLSQDEILLDYDSCTMAFVEPDATLSYAVRAVVVLNMRPLSNGEQNIAINKSEAREARQLSIEWTGTPETGDQVLALGTELIQSLTMTNANPNGRPSHVADSAARQGWADISSVDGFVQQLQKTQQVAG